MFIRTCGTWTAALLVLVLVLGCGSTADEAREADAVPANADPIDTQQGGAAAWARRFGGLGDELIVAAASAPDGGIVLVTSNGGAPTVGKPEALGVVRLRADGSIAWSRVYPMLSATYTEISVAVTGLGNVFFAVRAPCLVGEPCPDFGGGPFPTSAPSQAPIILVKLSPAGAFVWQRVEPVEYGLSQVAVDANGSAALGLVRPVHGGPYRPHIVKYRWDGTRLWDLPAPDLDGDGTGWPTALAFDPAGNLAVGDGTAFGSLDPAGQLRWAARLATTTPVSGRVVSIGTTAMGTVVAFVEHGQGTISWAGTQSTVQNPRGDALFLAVAEATGAPRFGRLIGADRYPYGAAVDPAGRVAILTHGSGGLCPGRLERWNLAGDQLWTRLLDGCASGTMLWRGIVVDPVSHHVRTFGELTGTVTFGGGISATSKGGVDGLLLDVMP